MRAQVHDCSPEDVLEEWEGLFAADHEATPFASPGWGRAWWRHWGGSVRPWLVLARAGVDVRGMASLVIERHGPLRVLRPLGGEPADHWVVLAPRG
jgi:CelD/BcsL family acetyltransferase involved in cellulose biosynthesis